MLDLTQARAAAETKIALYEQLLEECGDELDQEPPEVAMARVLLELTATPLWREKPWEWVEAGGRWFVNTQLGPYVIYEDFAWRFANTVTTAPSLEAAQAACLADYHERLSVGMERMGSIDVAHPRSPSTASQAVFSASSRISSQSHG